MLRVFNHYISVRKLALFLVESAAIGIACAAGATLVTRTFVGGVEPLVEHRTLPWALTLSALFVPTFQLMIYLTDLYDLRIAHEDRSHGGGLLRAAGLTLLGVGIVTTLLGLAMPSGALVGGAVGAIGGAILVRANMPAVVGEPSRVLLVGSLAKLRDVQALIDEGGERSFVIAGILRLPDERAPVHAEARRVRADYVVVAPEGESSGMAEELLRCRFEGKRVYDAAGFCERLLRRIPVANLRAEDLAFADEITSSVGRRLAKRLFDLLAASALLVLTLPLTLLVAIAIKLDSPGPVFYGQERVGRSGSVFRLWKFRSMRVDAERDGAVWARANDDRVTRVGRFIRKTRIDEVPQFLNVLMGEMSFVGPRPERPVFVDKLKQQIPYYGFREGVKPGITGWAQIRYPYGASVEDARNKLEFDLYYVKNESLFLDLAIIFHTVRHVLTGRGAR